MIDEFHLLTSAPIGIQQDYLRDRDVAECKIDEVGIVVPFKPQDVYSFLSGRGIGVGSGRGSGSGIGVGSGIGSGSGRGVGSGSGRGRGSGIGSGSGIDIYPGVDAMRVGKSYLCFLGDWHVFVGRVVEQIGPLTYEMEYASKVDIERYGDRWHDLCAGDKELRKGATYWHQPGKIVVPLSICAVEWFGDLPHPDYVSVK